eukprot:25934-Chlamydomonas_euryale.AAC.1
MSGAPISGSGLSLPATLDTCLLGTEQRVECRATSLAEIMHRYRGRMDVKWVWGRAEVSACTGERGWGPARRQVGLGEGVATPTSPHLQHLLPVQPHKVLVNVVTNRSAAAAAFG